MQEQRPGAIPGISFLVKTFEARLHARSARLSDMPTGNTLQAQVPDLK